MRLNYIFRNAARWDNARRFFCIFTSIFSLYVVIIVVTSFVEKRTTFYFWAKNGLILAINEKMNTLYQFCFQCHKMRFL